MVWLGPRKSQVAFWRLFHTQPSKESLQENLQEDRGNLQEEKQRSTRSLQEDAESSFDYFEGVRVGGKGG